jgi:hypothetical protein
LAKLSAKTIVLPLPFIISAISKIILRACLITTVTAFRHSGSFESGAMIISVHCADGTIIAADKRKTENKYEGNNFIANTHKKTSTIIFILVFTKRGNSFLIDYSSALAAILYNLSETSAGVNI